MKRLISAALCLALALGLMAGCGSLEDVDLGVSAAPENTGAGDASSLQLDWDAARAKHELDATVLTVDGENADWGEFFYWLYYCYTNYVNDMGAVTDFSTPYIYNSEMTIGEMLIDAAKSYCVQYHALDVNARKEGVELTKEDEEALQALLESDIKEIAGEDGTEEELFAALEETYVSRELYELMNRTAALYSRAYNTLYGGTGEKLTEQEVKDFADECSFMTAKHILIQTTDAEGEPIDEAAKAEKLAEAEEIYAQLEGKSGQELESAFDALMQEKSEDTGLAAFPDGYCFTADDMVTEFSEAVAALEPGQLSGIVESSFGYHIILRMPLTAEDRVLQFDSTGTPYTIRAVAAANLYEARLNGWIENAETVWAAEFEDLDLNELFDLN